jgi:hypothetical protein
MSMTMTMTMTMTKPYRYLAMLAAFVSWSAFARKLPAFQTRSCRLSNCRGRESPRVVSLQLLLAPADTPAVGIPDDEPHRPTALVMSSNNIRQEDRFLFGVPNEVYQDVVSSTSLQPSMISSTTTIAETDERSSFSAQNAGKWFFVTYVVVSLAAGFKEFAVRFQKWQENNTK